MSCRSQARRRRFRAEIYDPHAHCVENRGRKAAHKVDLNDEIVASLSAKGREYAVHDAVQPGLFVRIRPNGGISYYFRPRGRSNKKTVSLGSATSLSIAEARRKAIELEVQLQKGCNLSDLSASRPPDTVKRAFEAYRSRERSGDEWFKRVVREFDSVILPELGDVRLSGLTLQDVEPLFTERGTYYGRRNLQSIVSSFLTWCVSTGRIDRNVLKGGRTVPRPEPRQPMWLDGPDLKVVWDACEKLPSPWRNAFRLLIVSGYPMREILRFPANVGHRWSIEEYRFGPLAKEILGEMIRPDGRYLFVAQGKMKPMTFQQGMLNQLRETTFLGAFTTGDIHRSSIATVPIGRGIGFQWDDFSPACQRNIHCGDEVML